MNITPLNEYVVVEKSEEVKQTDSGIYVVKKNDMPETHEAIVVAVTEKHKDELKKGDKIIYKHFRNTTIGKYELIRFDDIFGIYGQK